VSAPGAHEVILSGRLARVAGVRDEMAQRIARVHVAPGFGPAIGGIAEAPVHVLTGFAEVAELAAQGAALIADGLAGGRSAALVETLGIREARGTVLDHLYVIEPATARARLGIA